MLHVSGNRHARELLQRDRMSTSGGVPNGNRPTLEGNRPYARGSVNSARLASFLFTSIYRNRALASRASAGRMPLHDQREPEGMNRIFEPISNHPAAALAIGISLIGIIGAPRLSLRATRGVVTVALYTIVVILMTPPGLLMIALERVGLLSKLPAAGDDAGMRAYREALVRLHEENVGLTIPNDGVSRPPFE
jgi:hypothetical protein